MLKTIKPRNSLSKQQVKNIKFGSVFIVMDKEFNPKSPENKTRHVVFLGKKGGSLILAPIKHTSPSRMELKNFDGNRSIYLDKIRYFSKNKVYPLNDFKDKGNDYLTIEEKVELKKRYKRYKK